MGNPRIPWVTSGEALRARLLRPEQVAPTAPEAEMPSYLESFLASLRLLVGVPLEYLVPDARLLPPESIRFFYLDRSWTDRLVDGALAVGKPGTREQAHHQSHAEGVRARLDVAERRVRARRLGKTPPPADPSGGPDAVVTGFLLRSAAVSGWPELSVRAFDSDLPENAGPAEQAAHQLPTLRLERLSPAVLLALFAGVPALVVCEEPHHGVQLGLVLKGGAYRLTPRTAAGVPVGPENDLDVPVRAGQPRVVAIAELRRRLHQQATSHPALGLPAQTGSAALAIELLEVPWRQRFEGTDEPRRAPVAPGFDPRGAVAAQVADASIRRAVEEAGR